MQKGTVAVKVVVDVVKGCCMDMRRTCVRVHLRRTARGGCPSDYLCCMRNFQGGVSMVYVCVCLCVRICVRADLNRDESSSLLPFVSVNKPVHVQNHTDCDTHVHSICMYCEWGGGVCGEIDTLGNEKETVCIVSWEGAYVGRSTRLGTRKRLCVCVCVCV